MYITSFKNGCKTLSGQLWFTKTTHIYVLKWKFTHNTINLPTLTASVHFLSSAHYKAKTVSCLYERQNVRQLCSKASFVTMNQEQELNSVTKMNRPQSHKGQGRFWCSCGMQEDYISEESVTAELLAMWSVLSLSTSVKRPKTKYVLYFCTLLSKCPSVFTNFTEYRIKILPRLLYRNTIKMKYQQLIF